MTPPVFPHPGIDVTFCRDLIQFKRESMYK